MNVHHIHWVYLLGALFCYGSNSNYSNIVYLISHQSFPLPEDCLGHFRHWLLVPTLEKMGFIVRAATYQDNLSDAALVISLQFPRNSVEQEALLQAQHAKKAAIILEPPIIFPAAYDKSRYALFDYVFTWHDGLVDGKKYRKIILPYSFTTITDTLPSFTERKFCTLINGSKTYPHPEELYSARIKAINFLKLEFYGAGWDKKKFPTYQGRVESKSAVLRQYKFCICFENIKNIPGYISEKIGDCFAAGCIPIYWGAANIEQFIPANCFIDMRTFAGNPKGFGPFKELARYLKQFDELQYTTMLQNIKNFVASDQVKLFSREFFAYSIAATIFPDNVAQAYDSAALQQLQKLSSLVPPVL